MSDLSKPELSKDVIAEKRKSLAQKHYICKYIDETLESVLLRLYDSWNDLPDEERTQIIREREALVRALQESRTRYERCRHVARFLSFLEGLDVALTVTFNQMAYGKAPFVQRSSAGPDDSILHALIQLLHADPGSHYRIRSGHPYHLEAAAPEAPTRSNPHATDAGADASTLYAVDKETSHAGTDFRYFTKVDFPETIENDTDRQHTLVVQLLLEPPEESAVSGQVDVLLSDPSKPEMVDVKVTAPGFVEQTGCWHRSIQVFASQNSQPAIFLLQLDDPALQERTLTIDFYYKGRNIGSFVFETEVVSRILGRTRFKLPFTGNRQPEPTDIHPSVMGTARARRAVGELHLPERAPEPVDVELRITRPDEQTLRFTLHSAHGHMGYHWRDVGEVTLGQLNDPERMLGVYYTQLNRLAAKPLEYRRRQEAEDAQREIENLGIALYDQLFPPELKKEYWNLLRLRDRIERDSRRLMSLLITSDEPWIPWELVLPYEDGQQPSDFLAAAFQLSRWLAGRGPGARLEVRTAQLVAPSLDLAFVSQEVTNFAQLARQGIHVGNPIRTHDQFLNLAQQGDVQILHVATHGQFRTDLPGESPITLQDKPLLLRDLNRRRGAGLSRDRPLVFFNTCHSGRLSLDLTRPDGWAQRMVDVLGVTAFIGSHWEIHDELAALFSRTFYGRLLQGERLGRAFHSARQAVRRQQPANPTWLAYTLYGDPNCRIDTAT